MQLLKAQNITDTSTITLLNIITIHLSIHYQWLQLPEASSHRVKAGRQRGQETTSSQRLRPLQTNTYGQFSITHMHVFGLTRKLKIMENPDDTGEHDNSF